MKPEKLPLASMDVSEKKHAQLKQFFPGAFTETRNDAGDLVESIDLEKLRAELGTFSEVFESRRERYGMDWPDHQGTDRRGGGGRAVPFHLPGSRLPRQRPAQGQRGADRQGVQPGARQDRGPELPNGVR